jgi:predicted XRE-type DNA-binding protein
VNRSNPEPEHTFSSGNVFDDLGLPASDELIAKATLAHQIASIATHRHLTQTETARLLGTTQPKVSDLFAGRLAGFSMERLMRFLNALDRDVCIVVSPKPRSRSSAVLQVTGRRMRVDASRTETVRKSSKRINLTRRNA